MVPLRHHRKERQHFCQQGEGDLRDDNPFDVRRIVLRVGQDKDLCGAAASAVVVVVVFPVAVMVDAFAGNIAVQPDKVPAPVVMTGMNAEPHVRQYIGESRQQAEQGSGRLSHPCKNKEKCVYLQINMPF